MRSTPDEWASSCVRIPRTIERRCICFAVCGRSSEKWTPGTLVGMVRNGPPNWVLGLGSQDSSCEMPPSSQMKRTCLRFRCTSAARAGWRNASAPAAPSPWCCGRERRWSLEWQAKRCFISVVDAELGGGGQRPGEVGQRRGLVAGRCEVRLHVGDLPGRRGTGKDGQIEFIGDGGRG